MIIDNWKKLIWIFLFENTENLSIVLMWPWIWIFKDFVPRKIISCQVLIKVLWMLSVLFTNKLLSVDSPPLTPLQLNWGFWELFPSQYLWCHQVSTIININAFCITSIVERVMRSYSFEGNVVMLIWFHMTMIHC